MAAQNRASRPFGNDGTCKPFVRDVVLIEAGSLERQSQVLIWTLRCSPTLPCVCTPMPSTIVALCPDTCCGTT